MGTTVQKLQRILETKTGFKDLIIEKGGVITETTTFYEYIDEARKLMEGGKVVVEEASATAVPNEGFVEKIYFNTSLSPEEVDQIITDANLEWVNGGGYILFSNDDNTISVVILNIGKAYGTGVDAYMITGIAGETQVDIYISSILEGEMGASGWLVDGYDVSCEANAASGFQNEALKQIFSITPFDGESFHKELKGTYEPVTVEVTENSSVDLTTYWDNQQMPITVNVNVESSGDSGVPLQPATEEEMNNLLVNENIGKVFLYTGETNANFTNGEYYIIEEVTE